ncbi:MAG: ESPR-type extended signal peptide-containing protein [Dialister sp.]|nr:ESPR-type extended signal peptide-containing protein [Dialister sp.]
MNKIYKLIWSKTKNCWVVASELANSHAKSASGRVKGSVLAASVLTVLLGSALFPMDAVYAADPVADGQTHYVSVGVKQGEKIKVRKNVYDTNGHFLRVEEEEVEINPTENYNPPANPSVNFIGIGADLSQYGNGSVGVGFKTGAAEYGTALGTNARAGSLGDVAIGWQAFTSGYVGSAGKYTAPNKIAIGTQSTALEENGISIGTKSKTLGKNSITIGNEAETSSEGDQKDGNASIAIGNKAKIQGQHNVAIGSGVTVGVGEKDSASSYVVAIGSDSHAYDTDSVVIGGHSEVRENGVVVGNYSKAGMQSVALGSDIEAGEWSIAIGLSSKAKNYAIAMGHSSEASAADSVAFGNNASAKGIGAIAIGSENDVTNGGAQAYSEDTIAIGRGSVAGNKDDTATAYNSVAVGREARAYGKNSIALGGTANVGDIWQKQLADGGTAIGSSSNAALENATAIGYKSIAYGKDAVTLGANTRADIDGGVALGSDSNVGSYSSSSYGKAGKVGYDPLGAGADETSTWKATKAAVSVGNQQKDITRQIINVAAGTDNTDAVNVAQLKTLGRKAWKDLAEAKDQLGARIATNTTSITALSGKVRTNTQDIGRLKTDVSTNDTRIRYLYDNMPFMHYVSVKSNGSAPNEGNYKNDGAKAEASIAIGAHTASDGDSAVALGAHSFARGQDSVIVGAASYNSTGSTVTPKEEQFNQSIIVGSQNDIYALKKDSGGREDTILGSKNNITESHGTFVRGVGNYVADAYNDEVMTAAEKEKLEDYLLDPEGASEGPVGLFEKGRSHVTVDGDGNAVAGAIYTRVSGVSNEISSSNDKPKSSYNIVTGNRNTLGDSSHNLIMGDNHELNDVDGNIIIGSLTKKAKTEASNVTILGNDANVSVEGGVALGTESVASTAAGAFGYDPLTGEASTETGPAWKSGNGAVSVGTADKTRQITNLAAGMADTDAVNVAQLKAIKKKIDNGAIHYFSVNSKDKDADSNYENDGAKGTDAVAIGSSAKAQREFATAVGAKTAAAGKGANAYGGGIAAGEGTVAIGQNAVAALKSGITQEEYDALKNYQKALYISDNKGLYYQYRYQRGKIARDEQNYNVAIGSGAESYANQTLSLGYKAKSDVDGGVAIGAESSANRQAGGIGYIATGSSATFEDALTTLNQKEDYDNWTAIVDDASKKEYDNLTRKFDLARTKESKDKAKAALDAWKEQHADFVEALAAKEKLEATWKATTAAVSVGKDEINEAGNRVIASRQITNVAAGTEDTDAVNVAQLKTAKTTVEAGDYVTVEKGTKEGTDGTIYTVTGPTLSIDGGNLTVADDEKDGKKVGYKLSLNKELTGLTSVSSDTFKSGENVTINNKGLTITGGPSVTTDGINAGDKKITNVADGDVSATSTDAVNGKQLNELKQNVAENKVTVEAAKDSQITVTAEKQADKSTKYVVDIEKDGTIGGAKDGNLVTGKTVKDYVDANKVTVTGDEDGSGVKVENIAEDGQPANYKVSLGDKVKVGNVVIDDKDGKGSISGLSEVTIGENVTLDKTGLTIKEGPSVTTKGIDAGKKKITNVADGDVSENSTDAVNGGQLYKLQQTVAGNKVTVEAAANSQITVSAETQADKSTKYVVDIAKDGTIGGAKDGNLVTGETVKEYVDANKTTVTGDEESGIKVENIAEDGQPANYKVSLGDKIKAGDVTIDGTKDKGQITGLSNTTWDAENIVSGRAATEDQLKQVSENAVAEAAKKQTTLVAGDYVTVSEGTNAAGGKEYTVTGPKLAVADGEENLVVGDITEGGKKVGYNLKLNKELKGLTSVSSDTFKSGDNVTINKDGLTIKDGPSVKKDGIDAGGKTITNVKDGKADTDAVNVRQLNAIANEGNQNIAILGGKVGELGNRVNRVGAGAAALAALHPLDFDPDDKWDFAAGYGNYKGANAAAIGAYYRPNEDTMVSVGGSFGGGENMVNAGVSVKLGQGNRVTTSRVAMAKEIKDLRAEVEVLRQAVTGIGQGQTPDPVKMKLFPDIAKNHWAYEAVEELTKQGLLEGYPDGTFGGDRMMTRYEFATLVYRAMQKGLNVNEKLIQEFEPELERFRIDVISKDKNGNPVIERVRVNEKKKAK